MKRTFYILIFLSTLSVSSFSQDDQSGNGGKLREKMIGYIQQKLSLSRDEASKFEPVFTNYLKELRSTNQEFKGDRLILQQKVVDLRLRYRDQFKPIIGEKRSNDVFTYEREFIKQVQEIRNERLQNHENGRADKRF